MDNTPEDHPQSQCEGQMYNDREWASYKEVWRYFWTTSTVSRKSGQISGGQANGEMTHIHTNTHTENGHWKLKARATLPTWGSTFSYINERERVEEKHRGDVKSLDIKSRKSRSYKHPTDLKSDWRSAAAMTLKTQHLSNSSSVEY